VPSTTNCSSGSADRLRPLRAGLVAAALVGLLLASAAPALGQEPCAANCNQASISVSYLSATQLNVGLSLTDGNGSALRYAIDGNFTPFVEGLPVNASTKSSILHTINQTEDSPFLAGFFGNRDGHVDAGEVSQFESLLAQEARLLPSASFLNPSFVHLKLDGMLPLSSAFGGFGFPGAVGPDSSSAPVDIDLNLTYTFAGNGSSGSDHAHTIALGWTTPVGFGLILNPTVGFTATTPAGTAITGTTGLSGSSVANDPWGWGGASTSGSFAPATSGNVTVSFHDAFPLGYVLIGLSAAIAVAAVAALLLLRRRRRRPSTATPSAAAPSG
jgi:hypothetical protein